MSYFLAFAASLIYIALKALQQRQVMAAEYLKMPVVSMAMAACEVFIMVNIVHTADSLGGLILLAVAIGLGAGLGSMLGTFLHVRSGRARNGKKATQ